MKEYKWRGLTYQIADEDLKFYPGAEPVHAESETTADPDEEQANAEPNEEQANAETNAEQVDAEPEAKAAPQPENKARKTAKNKDKE